MSCGAPFLSPLPCCGTEISGIGPSHLMCFPKLLLLSWWQSGTTATGPGRQERERERESDLPTWARTLREPVVTTGRSPADLSGLFGGRGEGRVWVVWVMCALEG